MANQLDNVIRSLIAEGGTQEDSRTPGVRKENWQRAHAFILFQGDCEALTGHSPFDNLESEHIPTVSSERGREAVPFGAASAFFLPPDVDQYLR